MRMIMTMATLKTVVMMIKYDDQMIDFGINKKSCLVMNKTVISIVSWFKSENQKIPKSTTENQQEFLYFDLH